MTLTKIKKKNQYTCNLLNIIIIYYVLNKLNIVIKYFHPLLVDMDPVYKPTPESSPELTKKSWFGSLMASEKDETFTILITGKPLSTVKADLIHALLSVSSNIYRVKKWHDTSS